MQTVATIGYEGAAVEPFLATLREASVDLLIDVRAVARSRRVGFAKTRLAANLQSAGIDYLHLRGLGTPSEGRAAAKAGDTATMRHVFREHLATPEAQTDLTTLADLVASGRNVALLCYEAAPTECHRSLVADALATLISAEIVHLSP